MRSFIFVAALSVCTWGLGLAQLPATQPSDAPATIRVSLPADAALTVDGQATQATSATRSFTTPALESGKRYFYTFKASFVRDGKTIAVEQRVPVRAGRESVVSLNVSGTSSAAVMAPGSTNYQSYYYNPQAPTAPAANTNYYYTPGNYAPAVPSPSEWVPGGFKTYNP